MLRLPGLLLAIALATAGCFGGPFGSVPPPRNDAAPLDEAAFNLTLVVGGLDRPVFLTQPAGGAPLFVVEQAGRIRTVTNGTLEATAFLDISDLIDAEGERGLLGLAFDPAFAGNGRFYVHYTDTGGDTILARYTVGANGRGDPASAVVLLTQDQPYGNHNGGMIAFGPDGAFYMGLGDGGGGGDPEGNGQDTTTILGAILRLDVGGDAAVAAPGNPFADGGGDPRVWAYGLRNPWRFSFDRETGDLFIGDVGQGNVEEIDYARAGEGAGRNYGWNVWEGDERFRPGNTNGDHTLPVATYPIHDEGRCAVTGGYLYRGAANPSLEGLYLYGDYCAGTIWGLTGADGEWQTRVIRETDLQVTSFGEDAAGELYVVDHGGGVYRLDP